MRRVEAFAPASVANLNVGYDTLGLSLQTLGDTIQLTENEEGKHRIINIQSEISLPYDVDKNSATAVIQAMQDDGYGQDIFVDVILKKGFRAGSGLGSSAASSVAAAVAFNSLLEKSLQKDQLLHYCTIGEQVACGHPILDNVAASLYGGLILVQNGRVISLPMPENVYITLLFQQIEIRTEDARAILPREVPLEKATGQMANIALFIHALHEKNTELMKESMTDLLVQPYRKALIPNFDDLKKIAHKNAAIGFGISGSGPTVFSLSSNGEQAKTIEQEMLSLVQDELHTSISFIEHLTTNNHLGPKVHQI